ncbi:MAG: MBOAT family O-acyltransferase [Flavobacteriales bacterium]
MLFNSIEFLIFLPVVFCLYWFAANKHLKIQNTLLLVASYFFYSCWDWRFLFLLIFSTLLDFYTGLKMQHAGDARRKKFWFWLSISVNISFLGVFKYYNFFADSFAKAISTCGFEIHPATLSIILPVGISFYTFHGLSYVIDIYKNRIKAENSFIEYAVFVSFFPLLVAGPIERATHLLPQIKRNRIFEYSKAVDGMRQIVWGFFKKIVIADSCAEYADMMFNNTADQSGSNLIMGAIFFSIQIYGDFSGYSDIALGTARLFGIELLQNFSFPYFSRDIAEFWRRWHISLSSWFKDYLYIPLGGSRGGNWMRIRNTFIIFVVSGFWHGANWTFIAWGALNALFILPSILSKTNRNYIETVALGKSLPSSRELFQIAITFGLTTFAWIFFRSNSMEHAVNYIGGIFSTSTLSIPTIRPTSLLLIVMAFIIVEWAGRNHTYGLEKIGLKWWSPLRYSMYYFIVALIFWFSGKDQQFIYFQF